MLTLENIDFHYKKNQPVLQDISTQLQAGRICGLLGRNGEGKSTLFKLLQGYIPPHSGSIYHSQNKLQPRHRDTELLAEIFYLPETYRVPAISLNSYVDAYGPFYRNFNYERLQELCTAFELNPAQRLSQASLGQQRKAMLSFALASGCHLLLLDEPSNGLDIPSKAKMRQLLIEEIHDKRCIVISSHQVRDLEGLLDHVMILHQKRLIVDASLGYLEDLFVSHLSNQALPQALYSQPVTGGMVANLLRRQEVNEVNEDKLDLEALFIWASSTKDFKDGAGNRIELMER